MCCGCSHFPGGKMSEGWSSSSWEPVGGWGEALAGPRIRGSSFSRRLKRSSSLVLLHLPTLQALVEAMVDTVAVLCPPSGPSLNDILLIGIIVPIFQMRSPRLREMNQQRQSQAPSCAWATPWSWRLRALAP